MNLQSTDELVGSTRQFLRRYALPVFIIGLTFGMTLILSLDLGATGQVAVTVGQPAPMAVFAPRALSYTSDLLTEQEREQARRAIADQFTPLDLAIGRGQLAAARELFNFVEAVRADSSASLERRLDYLQAVEEITISEEAARSLLELSQAEYDGAKADTLAVIEDLMREEIRPGQLADFQRTAQRLTSLELNPAQTAVVTEIAHQFIVPTIFPNTEATNSLRDEAASAVAPVVREIAPNTLIIGAGDIVSEVQYETLDELGLLRTERNWQRVASMFMASLLVVSLTAAYWARFQRKRFPNGRYLLVLAGLILIYTLSAKIMLANETLSFWIPIASISMMVAVVYDTRFSILMTVLLAGLTGFIAPNSLDKAIVLASGGLVSILTLRDPQRLAAFFRAGLLAAAGYIFAIVMLWLLQNEEAASLALPVAYSLGNGLLSAALTLAGFYLLGGLFGIVTILQLQDLSRLDHPLLRELLRRAPGTYHHSIMVANLAEQAAERIGANSTLVRVGAFYHDVGKMIRPPFFTENQEGVNPHVSLDPYTSARIIIRHVEDGLDLARRYRLPFLIRDIIAEHHGTRMTKVFYHKAQEAAGEDGEVDPAPFTYDGPRPRSRESGIVMLADAIDATSTALRPDTEKAIEKLVDSIIEDDILDGQLNLSGLSMGDIEQLRSSFIETLKGRFHVRVQYPGNEELQAAIAAELPDGEYIAPANRSASESLSRSPHPAS